MTGFGAAAVESRHIAVRAEVRSVNHRHLQAKVRLPGELSGLEPRAEEVLRKRLTRGSVQATVRLHREGSAAQAAIDESLLAAYRRETRRLARDLDLSEPGLAELLSLPGVMEPAGLDGGDPAVERAVLKALDRACVELVGMREEEGAALRADLEGGLQSIAKVVARIGRRAPTVVRQHKRALEERVATLAGAGAAVSAADLAREVALLADRLDVSEELARIESHMAQVAKLVERGGAVGRKLDFLVQELFREANTLGSKAGDAKIAQDAVELKTLVERLREQVQNVE